jgi:hypothetical protein
MHSKKVVSAHPSVCLSSWLYVSSPTLLNLFQFNLVLVSAHPSVCLSVYLTMFHLQHYSIYFSSIWNSLSAHPSVCLSDCMFHLQHYSMYFNSIWYWVSAHPSVCLSIWLYVSSPTLLSVFQFNLEFKVVYLQHITLACNSKI